MTTYTPVAPLVDGDRVEGFRCGEPSLDDWLQRRAWPNQIANFSRTYVTTDRHRVVGYCALSCASMRRADTTRRARRHAPKEVPAILLGRLAIDVDHQGRQLGAGLLADAMQVAVRTSELVGARMLVVNALDHRAAVFYRRFGFEPSPSDPLDLMVTIDVIRSST